MGGVHCSAASFVLHPAPVMQFLKLARLGQHRQSCLPASGILTNNGGGGHHSLPLLSTLVRPLPPPLSRPRIGSIHRTGVCVVRPAGGGFHRPAATTHTRLAVFVHDSRFPSAVDGRRSSSMMVDIGCFPVSHPTQLARRRLPAAASEPEDGLGGLVDMQAGTTKAEERCFPLPAAETGNQTPRNMASSLGSSSKHISR